MNSCGRGLLCTVGKLSPQKWLFHSGRIVDYKRWETGTDLGKPRVIFSLSGLPQSLRDCSLTREPNAIVLKEALK